MGWMGFTMLVLFAFALITVPGALVLWLLRIRDARLLLLGPATGIGVLGLLTFIASPIGGWGWGYIIGLVAFLVLLVILQWRLRRNVTVPLPRVPWRAVSYALLGIVAFALVYVPVIMAYWVGPSSPQSFGDTPFHSQGTVLVWLSGDVNPFSALGGIYDPIRPISVYYPTLWHALASLFLPWVNVGGATNTLVLVVGLLAWPLSLSALASSLAGKHQVAAFWTPFLASFFVVFPAEILFRNAMYPFGLSVLSVPTFIAVMVWMGDSRVRNRDALWRLGAAGLLIFLGAVAAQPATAIAIGIAGLGFAMAIFMRFMYRRARSGHALSSALAVVGVWAVLIGVIRIGAMVPIVKQLGKFQRASLPLRGAAVQFFEGAALDGGETTVALMPWPVVMVAALIGLAVLVRKARGQMLLTAGIFLSVSYVVATGPDSWLRDLTGFWYKDYTRISVFVLSVFVAFAGVGVAWLIARLANRAPSHRLAIAVAASLVTVVCFEALSSAALRGSTVSIQARVRQGYSQEVDVSNHLDQDRATVLEAIDGEFDGGTYIMGLPVIAVQFVAGSSRSLSFAPLGSLLTDEQRMLGAHLDEILTNPEVCEAVNDLGVEGFLTIVPEHLDPAVRDGLPGYYGMLNVDMSEGFELIEQSGPIQLWRVTACSDPAA